MVPMPRQERSPEEREEWFDAVYSHLFGGDYRQLPRIGPPLIGGIALGGDALAFFHHELAMEVACNRAEPFVYRDEVLFSQLAVGIRLNGLRPVKIRVPQSVFSRILKPRERVGGLCLTTIHPYWQDNTRNEEVGVFGILEGTIPRALGWYSVGIPEKRSAFSLHPV
jgi:hypothetical protein